MAIGRKAPPLIAISMGDPAGIGAEIILKSAAVLARRRRAPSLVVIGDLKVMLETAWSARFYLLRPANWGS